MSLNEKERQLYRNMWDLIQRYKFGYIIYLPTKIYNKLSKFERLLCDYEGNKAQVNELYNELLEYESDILDELYSYDNPTKVIVNRQKKIDQTREDLDELHNEVMRALLSRQKVEDK